jgi:hypothetical protein
MKPNRADKQSAKTSPSTQSETTRKIQPGKPVTVNPDTGLVDLTLFDDTGSLVENLAIPPALYAQLQPYIQIALAETPPITIGELEACGGIHFGLLNQPLDDSTFTTVQLSRRMMDRIDKASLGDAKYPYVFAKLLRDGLHQAETRSCVNPFDATQNSDNVAVEMSVFNELVQRCFRSFNNDGQLPDEEMGHFELGLMLLNTRLRAALEESLYTLRLSLSHHGVKAA